MMGRIPLSASFVSTKYNATSVWLEKIPGVKVKRMHLNRGTHWQKLALYFECGGEWRQVKD